MNPKYAELYLDKYGDMLDAIPSMIYLWEYGQNFVDKKDPKAVRRVENLIYLLHNSVLSLDTKLGKNVKFGYGGIGCVIHKNCRIGNDVSIGQNVTLGGTPGATIDYQGERINVPVIENNCYIAPGSKVIGGVVIGKFSIFGANSVVNRSVPPFSIAVGSPAKVVKTISVGDLRKYKALLFPNSNLSLQEVENIFLEEFNS
ncbi:MAG: hypothetical protein U9N57_11950 [Pseudomonadota bacterium]|nr:hypothetical protein [Pseudomonadota bacterium]